MTTENSEAADIERGEKLNFEYGLMIVGIDHVYNAYQTYLKTEHEKFKNKMQTNGPFFIIWAGVDHVVENKEMKLGCFTSKKLAENEMKRLETKLRCGITKKVVRIPRLTLIYRTNFEHFDMMPFINKDISDRDFEKLQSMCEVPTTKKRKH